MADDADGTDHGAAEVGSVENVAANFAHGAVKGGPKGSVMVAPGVQ